MRISQRGSRETSARITSRAWTDADFGALSELLSANASAVLPEPPCLLPGDLAWRLPGTHPDRFLRLFFVDEGLVAFAWFEPLTGLEFELAAESAGSEALLGAIFEWAYEMRWSQPAAYPRFVDITDMEAWRREITAPQASSGPDGCFLTTVCPDYRQSRARWLIDQGFEATAHHAPVFFVDLSQPLPPPEPPRGCRLRAVTAADIPARVEAHRAAWVGSQFNVERYEEIRSRPAYREDLDVVLEEAGTFGSYCICWADEPSGVGHFEPVGTRADWRGRGAARAVILEGLRRLQNCGMRWARVSTACFNAPAQALYRSCGFKQVGIERTFMKKLELR